MEPLKDGRHLFETDYHAEHAARPGFRITELRLSARQKVPWHYHTQVQDTFYVMDGRLRLFLREPKGVKIWKEVGQEEPGLVSEASPAD